MKRLAVSSAHALSAHALSEHGREALRLRPDPLLDQFPALGQGADLAFSLVDVDANMILGWPLLTAAMTAGVLLWGRVGHHVKREASRFIPSTLERGCHVIMTLPSRPPA